MYIGANIKTTHVMDCVMTTHTILPYKDMWWLPVDISHDLYTNINY